ncbi:SDR family NAD(P)-dependent oxidoreductase [Streptomyces racemochromogenes]|uniref:SDR family NAD(P)-dependent oxidoreductase n=1 Tax=Streptomyces racemochromogenes TaxID=67353 RepID=UPI0031E8A345
MPPDRLPAPSPHQSASSQRPVVTGATSGIGYETTRQLAERGATVLLHGRTPEESQAATDRLIATAGVCETGLLPLYGHEGAPAAEGARHVARLCDAATEIVNGAYYDRSERVAPAPAATEDRTVKRLNKLADLLVGHTV